MKSEMISAFGFSVIWVGMAIVLAAFAIGAAGIIHLSMPMLILATLVGSLLIGIFMVVIGDIGVEHGLSFPVYMRAPFGTIRDTSSFTCSRVYSIMLVWY